MEPRYNEPLYNEVLGITNDFLRPSSNIIYMEKNLNVTKTRYSEQILPVPCPFVISRYMGKVNEMEVFSSTPDAAEHNTRVDFPNSFDLDL